jgi:hypothetical protein
MLTCPSLDAALHIADSSGQLRKNLQLWNLPVDFWTAVEKGTQSYRSDPKKAKDRELSTMPFMVTLNRQRKTLKSAYHAQSKIGWENFTKERFAEEWIKFIETHYANQGYTLKARNWAPTFISTLWEHMQRVWKFRNYIYHADANGRIVRYKCEEQQQRMEKIWEHHLELQGQLWQDQTTHFDHRETIYNLIYDSQRCWASLAEMYLHEAECPPMAEQNAFAQYVASILGVG